MQQNCSLPRFSTERLEYKRSKAVGNFSYRVESLFLQAIGRITRPRGSGAKETKRKNVAGAT